MTRSYYPDPEDRLLCFEELADLLGCSAGHLRNLKSRGLGPLPVKIGRSVRFRLGDVRVWIDAQVEARETPAAAIEGGSEEEGR